MPTPTMTRTLTSTPIRTRTQSRTRRRTQTRTRGQTQIPVPPILGIPPSRSPTPGRNRHDKSIEWPLHESANNGSEALPPQEEENWTPSAALTTNFDWFMENVDW